MSADLIARLREWAEKPNEGDPIIDSMVGDIAEAADALEARLVARSTGLLDPDMPAQQLRLHMGEVTAQEMRTARAAIRWANTAAEARIASVRDESVEECARLAEGRFTSDSVPKSKKGRPYASGEVAIYASTAIADRIRALRAPPAPKQEGA